MSEALDELRNLIVMELGVRKSKDVLALLDKALASEREECAKVAERCVTQNACQRYLHQTNEEIAAAIRSRKGEER